MEQEKQAASPAKKSAPAEAPTKKTSSTTPKKVTPTKSEKKVPQAVAPKKATPTATPTKSSKTKSSKTKSEKKVAPTVAPTKKTTPAVPKKATPAKSKTPSPTKVTPVVEPTKIAPPAMPIKVVPATLPPRETNQPQKKQAIEGKKCNDLIMILDPKGFEKLNTQANSLCYDLIVALQEKTAPIIVTSNIVENFCFWKTEHTEILKKPLEVSAPQILNFAICLISTELNDNDWHCYTHKQANLILLIPKQYIANRVPQSVTNINEQIKTCGFNITNLDKINNASHETVLKQLQIRNTKTPINIANALESMVIKIEKSPDSITDIPTWNIFMIGHGGPAAKKKNIKAWLANDQQDLVSLEKDLELVEQKTLKPSLELEIERTKERIQRGSAQLQSAETLSDEAILSQSAIVTGIEFNDFSQLLKFFDSGIQASFLHYTTCFAGGYNQTFVNEILSQLKVNFIISTQGINEQSVTGDAPRMKRNENGTGVILSTLRWIPFFGILENFFGNPTKFVNTKGKQESWQKDPIAAIVSNVITTRDIQQNQPFVRIPSVGVFNALTVDKTVKILTNSITRAHELEGRAIDFTDPNIKNILVYPTSIGVPLKIGRSIYFISPTPAYITPNMSTVHIFEEIIADDQLTNIIGNFVSLNASYSKIIFVVKKLQCLDYNNSGLAVGAGKPITIENMTIEITGDQSSASTYLYAKIKVTLVFNDKTYTLSKDVKNVSAATVASTLLSQPLLASTDINSDMQRQFVNDLENKIDTTFAVQKPGALKKVLLLKTLDGLERAIDPEQLEQEKAWLEKNKKPATVFINKLARYKDDLAKLKEQIDQLSAAEMNSQERDSVQKRIANVQAKIAETMPT